MLVFHTTEHSIVLFIGGKSSVFEKSLLKSGGLSWISLAVCPRTLGYDPQGQTGERRAHDKMAHATLMKSTASSSQRHFTRKHPYSEWYLTFRWMDRERETDWERDSVCAWERERERDLHIQHQRILWPVGNLLLIAKLSSFNTWSRVTEPYITIGFTSISHYNLSGSLLPLDGLFVVS